MQSQDEMFTEGDQKRRDPVKLPLWVSLILLVLLIAVIAWAQFSRSSVEQRFQRERQELTEKLNAEKGALMARAQHALVQQSEEAFRLFGTALGWAVRSAVMRNNRDEVDQYFTELVKHERVRLALLADPGGKIVVSSDRNFQGAEFAQHFPVALLQGTSVAVHAGEGELKRLVIPIHGLSKNLGTVLVLYQAATMPAK